MKLQGEKHHKAKLTEDQVRWIRKMHKGGHPTLGCSALAKRFNMNEKNMKKVLNRETWKHVEDFDPLA